MVGARWEDAQRVEVGEEVAAHLKGAGELDDFSGVDDTGRDESV